MLLFFVEDIRNKVIKYIYICCKNECDTDLRKEKVKEGLTDRWQEVLDLTNPILFLNQIMATLNRMKSGWEFEPIAFEKIKEIYMASAQYVMREPTQHEFSRAIDILNLEL